MFINFNIKRRGSGKTTGLIKKLEHFIYNNENSNVLFITLNEISLLNIRNVLINKNASVVNFEDNLEYNDSKIKIVSSSIFITKLIGCEFDLILVDDFLYYDKIVQKNISNYLSNRYNSEIVISTTPYKRHKGALLEHCMFRRKFGLKIAFEDFPDEDREDLIYLSRNIITHPRTIINCDYDIVKEYYENTEQFSTEYLGQFFI